MFKLVSAVVGVAVLVAIHLKDPHLGPDDDHIKSVACQFCLAECMPNQE
jgi:hypothetical protein